MPITYFKINKSMNSILIALAAIALTILLAIIIVKFIPLKLRWLVSILLLAGSIFLAFLIYQGIMEPIKFNKEKKVRYAKVIKNLKVLRDAQIKHKEVKGRYAKGKNELIQFIENDSLVITEINNVKEIQELTGGLTKEISVKKIDTIGFEPVSKYFKDKDYKNMFNVPGTDKEFTLETGEVEKVVGFMVPVFEAKTEKADILKGLNYSLIKQEIEAIEADQIKGEFVSVGSLAEVSTSGNWPPYYDKNDETKE